MAIDAFGGVDVLRTVDVPAPEPGKNEVLIGVPFTSVNPVDWKIREGMLSGMFPHEFPIIPGLVESGAVRAPVIEQMDLRDAAEARRRSKAGHVRGKIVLKII